MLILAFNCYMNDSAAAIMVDGEVIAAIEEERFIGKKHTGAFPSNAIKFCLEAADCTIDDIDAVAFNMKPWLHFHRRLGLIARHVPRSLRFGASHGPKWFSMIAVKEKLRREFPTKSIIPGYEFYWVEHHQAHAASAFYPSGFERAAIMTWDGSGELASWQMSLGSGNRISKIAEGYYPHSLGYLYSTITQYLGFRVHGGEGKVMGLASYGDDSYFNDFEDLVRFQGDGTFRLDLSYFDFQRGLSRFYSQKLIDRFGPAREPESEITPRHQNIASALQHIFEKAAFSLLDRLYAETKTKYLCISGGVGLNGLLNGKIQAQTPFEELYIQPGANDAGCSLGALFWVHCMEKGLLHHPLKNHVYLGASYDDKRVEAALRAKGLSYQRTDEVWELAARMLADGKIVGWFQGRMEFGPRALGNRSILADPRIAEMKDILNSRVKHRESFRPFAPAVLAHKSGEYFASAYPSPFMLLIFDVLPGKRSVIPAVTHVDGTGRVQTVSLADNARFYRLIQAFERLTGVPVVLNTSFNVRGQPIVNTPTEAIDCFLSTGMDALVINDFIVLK